MLLVYQHGGIILSFYKTLLKIYKITKKVKKKIDFRIIMFIVYDIIRKTIRMIKLTFIFYLQRKVDHIQSYLVKLFYR